MAVVCRRLTDWWLVPHFKACHYISVLSTFEKPVVGVKLYKITFSFFIFPFFIRHEHMGHSCEIGTGPFLGWKKSKWRLGLQNGQFCNVIVHSITKKSFGNLNFRFLAHHGPKTNISCPGMTHLKIQFFLDIWSKKVNKAFPTSLFQLIIVCLIQKQFGLPF